MKFSKTLSKKYLIWGLLILIAIGYAGYRYFSNSSAQTRYVLAAVKKRTLTVSTLGTGQVAAVSQINITSNVSGNVVYVGAQDGQKAAAGKLILQLDDTDAQKAVRDAQTNLEAAQLTLAKLKEPADNASLIQSQNTLAAAKDSKTTADSNFSKSANDGYSSVANAFLDLPNIMTGIKNILYNNDYVSNQYNIDYYATAILNYDSAVLVYRDNAQNAYQTAKSAFDQNFSDYKNITRNSDSSQILSLINETYSTTKSIAEAVKNANNLVQFYKDALTTRNLSYNSKADTVLTNLNTYITESNSHLTDLLSNQNTIKNNQAAVDSAARNITAASSSLDKLAAGADVLDIQSAELTVKQKENALLDAKQNLNYYYIRAPFNGVVTKVNFDKGARVNVNDAVATFIIQKNVAEISLNEIDAANVKVGQKAILTFDAIPGLTINGSVQEIDAIGTISQGVVSYNVKISLNVDDPRVKPSMSVSASIITNIKDNVLTVPNSAVKTKNNISSVMAANASQTDVENSRHGGIVLATSPQNKQVQIGISNSQLTEIVSGLNEGDVIVVNTITGASAQTNSPQQSQSSLIRIPGVPGGGRKGD